MKIELPWISDKSMRALFSNANSSDSNSFHLLMVYHSSRKGGFNRTITIGECERILKKSNAHYILENL